MISLILALTLAVASPPQLCLHPARSATVRADFVSFNPCPKSCRTYVNRAGKWTLYEKCGACEVDHICPLACCGTDTIGNMQWLDKLENRSKGADCSKCLVKEVK